jgi:hypothetical protein
MLWKFMPAYYLIFEMKNIMIVDRQVLIVMFSFIQSHCIGVQVSHPEKWLGNFQITHDKSEAIIHCK